MHEFRHPETGQPIGAPVDDRPAALPAPVTLEGRFGRVERLDSRHAASLWFEVKDHASIWTYMSQYGPFPNSDTFAAWLNTRITLEDPYSYAIVGPDGRCLGIATLMEIRPAMRVVEVTASHTGLAWNAAACRAIAEHVASATTAAAQRSGR